MKRREFFQKTGIASAVVASSATLAGGAKPFARHDNQPEDSHQEHGHESVDGPLASAAIVFGSWTTDPPLNRFPNVSVAAANHHPLLPHLVRIKAGGAVSFLISGLHQVLVYGPGTRPEDVSAATVVNGAGSPPLPPLVDDPLNRVYRGLDPGLLPRDRVENVHFPNPGRYLVICGVLPHFTSGMFGYVKVLP